MKAIVCTAYGPPDVLALRDIPQPVPMKDEVRVKIRATSVSIGDVRMRKFDVPRAQWLFARLYLGVLRPKRAILGMELSGDVEAVGSGVTRFKVGDAVFASTFEADFGGYAEYKCLPESGLLARKPAGVTYEEAAAGPATGGLTALLNLRRANVQPGQAVLIYGASGSVGTFAVQLAKHFGATVTAVCSTRHLEMVAALGADHVLDYTAGDFTRHGDTYDLVFDAVGKLPAPQRKRALKPNGRSINVNNTSGKMTADDLSFLKERMEAGQVRTVIDRCYPLAEIVDAHRYVEQGHKAGNVAIMVSHSSV